MKKIIVFLFLIITAISCGQNPNNNNDWRTTYKECPDCDGEGSVNERCYCCSGYGYVLQYCSECDGTGTSLTIIQTQEPITCPDCWGGMEAMSVNTVTAPDMLIVTPAEVNDIIPAIFAKGKEQPSYSVS